MTPSGLIRLSGPAAILGGTMGILVRPMLTFAGFLAGPNDEKPREGGPRGCRRSPETAPSGKGSFGEPTTGEEN